MHNKLIKQLQLIYNISECLMFDERIYVLLPQFFVTVYTIVAQVLILVI